MCLRVVYVCCVDYGLGLTFECEPCSGSGVMRARPDHLESKSFWMGVGGDNPKLIRAVLLEDSL